MSFKKYDLYAQVDLFRIHQEFLTFLKKVEPDVYVTYHQALEQIEHLNPKDHSALILKIAPLLEEFLLTFFECTTPIEPDLEFKELYEVKRNVIQRTFLKKYGPSLEEPTEFYFTTQKDFCDRLKTYLADPVTFEKELDEMGRYATWAVMSVKGQQKHKKQALFSIAQKTDPFSLVDFTKITPHSRDGFDLTDEGITKEHALNNAYYCIKCHEQDKDSCSKGLRSKTDPSAYVQDAFSKELKGCPLGQKISEMNLLFERGHTLAALAVICIDNPLLALTGHRICNACRKACIYQKQDSVDIPSVESFILQEILRLEYGVEIYSLLTRWNPLNFKLPLAKPSSGHTVVVAGLGPSGIAMSHYMMQQGHAVIAFEGLRIDPFPDLPRYIKDYQELTVPLSKRHPDGFGGVMSYGITVRWDKNLLLLVRIILQRRSLFRLHSGVALGQNITLSQLKEKGISHVTLCLGAGNPKLLGLSNQLAPGCKLASDFLMSLHLNAPYKISNLSSNLTIELPCVVIGGGLTAIDAATEARAYYPKQLEKIEAVVEDLKKQGTFEAFYDSLDEKQAQQLDTFLAHAADLKKTPHLKEDLIEKWGGVHVVYRKKLVQAPCYTLNHEEVIKALEEGIHFKEDLTPLSFDLDERGSLKAITFNSAQGPHQLLAKSAILAIGTHLKQYDEEELAPTFVSVYGDMEASYTGNVVQALASVKDQQEALSGFINQTVVKTTAEDLLAWSDEYFKATVLSVKEIAPSIIEILLKAPSCAANFKPGQFFKLQRFVTPLSDSLMEPLALTGSWVEGDTISLIVLEMGASTKLCRNLLKGEQVILMGPSGTPTPLVKNQKILLVGGGLGNAVLFSIAKALRENGCFVTYIAGYKTLQSVFKKDLLEAHTDQLIWCCDEEEILKARPQDISIKGSVIDALNLNKDLLEDHTHSLVIGSDGMMRAVGALFKNGYLKNPSCQLASINAPMQCLMKGVCGQCLQRHVDPKTGIESYVYTCFEQDQDILQVDFEFLKNRLDQNKLQERLVNSLK